MGILRYGDFSDKNITLCAEGFSYAVYEMQVSCESLVLFSRGCGCENIGTEPCTGLYSAACFLCITSPPGEKSHRRALSLAYQESGVFHGYSWRLAVEF